MTGCSTRTRSRKLPNRFVDRALQVQSRTHEVFHLPSLIRAKAELAVSAPDFGDPEQLYRLALALAQ